MRTPNQKLEQTIKELQEEIKRLKNPKPRDFSTHYQWRVTHVTYVNDEPIESWDYFPNMPLSAVLHLRDRDTLEKPEGRRTVSAVYKVPVDDQGLEIITRSLWGL